jgi:dTDP-4-amino-4,6-dideoxygalactose transaminase
MGCFSFYPTKNLGGFGDGGMLTTQDDELVARLRILRDHGQHPTYHHAMVGINSRLDSIQAAVLNVKLAHLDRWVQQRMENAQRYNRLFAEAGLGHVIGLPCLATEHRTVWNQYTIRAADGRRDELTAHLARNGIGAAVYYPVPLHLQKCFQTLGYREGSLLETERAAREVLSLPIFPGLTEVQQRRVVDQISEFYRNSTRQACEVCKRPKFLDARQVTPVDASSRARLRG